MIPRPRAMYHRAVLCEPASDEPGEASSPESTTQSSQVLKFDQQEATDSKVGSDEAREKLGGMERASGETSSLEQMETETERKRI